VIFKRKPERFRKWTHNYRAGRRWPLAGVVAILGSEAQDAVFLDTRLVDRLGPWVFQLRTVGEQTWQVDQEALGEELRHLAAIADLSDEDVITINQAIELVEYEIANRSGVSVVPPTIVP
jgi:hypothetical protein